MNKLDVINYLIEQATALGASDADAIIIDSSDLSAEVRLGNPTNIQYSQDACVSLRVLINQQQAIVSTSDFTQASLKNILQHAISMAKVTPANPHLFLASKEQLCTQIKALNLYDAAEPSAEDLLSKAREAEAIALEISEITNSDGASAGYSSNNFCF